MTGLPSRRQVLGGAAAGVLASLAGIPPAGAASAAVTYTAPDPRVWIHLNTGWRFIRADVTGAQAPGFNDSGWTSVNTPHTWNAVDGADGGNDYYRGVGWYRRHYTVPSDLAGKRLYLQFAGVNQVADVWVNGTYLGQHKGGYSRFRFDATAALLPGQDNVIAVKVTNARDTTIAPVGADYTFQGGIYRNVSLWAVDDLHVRMTDYAGPGIYLRQSNVTAASATVTVTTKLWNDSNTTRSVVVRTVIADKSGTIVAETSSTARTVPAATGTEIGQTVRIDNPHLWNGVADPYLHNASVEIHDVTAGGDRITDVVTERLGLRSLAVDADTGFHLNGSHLHLHGVNLHQERAVKGWAISDADHTQDLDLISEIGANAVRMAHYQHDQKDYNLTDERGMIVWAEIPLVDIVTDSAAFTTSTQNQLRELIRQNYNHPSIAFWGIGNEQLDYNDRHEQAARVTGRHRRSRGPRPALHLRRTRRGPRQRAGGAAHTDHGLQQVLRLVLRLQGQRPRSMGRQSARELPVPQDRHVGVRRRSQHHPARAQPSEAGPGRILAPRGVPVAVPRSGLEAARRPSLHLGHVRLGHVRLRFRRPQRRGPARHQRQGSGHPRPADPQGRLLLVQGQLGEHSDPLHHQPPLDPANRRHHRTQGLLQRGQSHRHPQRRPSVHPQQQ